jgi:hypothetical protein
MHETTDLFPGYVIDTSALIDLKPYPRDIFKTLWENLETLIREGNMIAPTEVLEELRRQRDDLLEWVKKSRFVVDLEPEQLAFVAEIERDFPDLVDKDKTTPEADPFVIALARAKGWKVVSQEKAAKPRARPKIPDVCPRYGVEYLSLFDFFREKKWEF